MISFIEVLRAIATALVLNSHFSDVYPYDFLSFGGGFGVALFFMISGFLIAKGKKKRFGQWYARKLYRLYIPLWLVKLAELILPPYETLSLRHIFNDFVFPGTWFGGSLIVLYFIFYFLVLADYSDKKTENSSRRCEIVITLCVIIYAVLYITKLPIACFSIRYLRIEEKFEVNNTYLMTQFIWLACMCWGYRMESKVQKNNNGLLPIIELAASVVLYLIIKICLKKTIITGIGILLGPVYLLFAISIFVIFSKQEEFFQRLLATPIGRFIKLFSKCSLEIYYVQMWWIYRLESIVFPVNWIVLVLVITLSGIGFHILSEKIVAILANKPQRA